MTFWLARFLLMLITVAFTSGAAAQIRVTGEVMHKGRLVTDMMLFHGEKEYSVDSLGRFELFLDSLGSIVHVGRFNLEGKQVLVNSEDHLVIKLSRKHFRKRSKSVICGFCFTGDTPICMASGASRPIASIAVGDTILTMDPEGVTPIPSVVTRVDALVHEDLYEIQFSNGEVVQSTSDHPIHVIGQGWSTVSGKVPFCNSTSTATLKVGDGCLHFNGDTISNVVVTSITPINGSQLTYNISGSSLGTTFFANGILVSDESEFLREPRTPLSDPPGSLP